MLSDHGYENSGSGSDNHVSGIQSHHEVHGLHMSHALAEHMLMRKKVF